MEQKEVEKRTEQTMNAVEAPEFEAVWERIEPRVKKSGGSSESSETVAAGRCRGVLRGYRMCGGDPDCGLQSKGNGDLVL